MDPNSRFQQNEHPPGFVHIVWHRRNASEKNIPNLPGLTQNKAPLFFDDSVSDPERNLNQHKDHSI